MSQSLSYVNEKRSLLYCSLSLSLFHFTLKQILSFESLIICSLGNLYIKENGIFKGFGHWIHYQQAQWLHHSASVFAFLLHFYFHRSVSLRPVYKFLKILFCAFFKCFSCFLNLGIGYLL